MDQDEASTKLLSDPDFIISPKHSNSLSKLINAYPNGVPVKVIARVLKMSTEDVEIIYQSAIIKLRQAIGET